jgi:hypothetical protein
MASQARHEMVSRDKLCASRTVAPLEKETRRTFAEVHLIVVLMLLWKFKNSVQMRPGAFQQRQMACKSLWKKQT